MTKRQVLDPVFVLTPGRSGSTLLRQILNAHPQIACPPESHLASTAAAIMNNWLNPDEPDTRGDRRRRALTDVRRVLGNYMRWVLRTEAKTIYCDKSLPNLDHVPLLLEAFPRSRFIAIHRHPMDVIASSVAASRWGYRAFGLFPYVSAQVDNTVSAIACHWCDRTAAILHVESNLQSDRLLRLRYETLVTSPTDVSTSVFEFVGVDDAPSVVWDAMEMRHVDGRGDRKIPFNWNIGRTSLGRGSAVPVSYLPEPVVSRMNDIMAELGYTSVGSDWNRIPSPLRQGIATPHDYIVLQSFMENVVQRNLRTLPLQVAPSGFRVRLIIEECRGSSHWVIDALERSVSLRPGTESVDCIVIARAATLLSIAMGFTELADAEAAGELRSGGSRSEWDVMAVRLVGLVLCGHDRSRSELAGAYTRDILASQAGASPRDTSAGG